MDLFDVERPVLDNEDLKTAQRLINEAQRAARAKHGIGVMLSPHEIFGILAEEWDELQKALRSDDPDRFFRELIDIAQTAQFGLACLVKAHGSD